MAEYVALAMASLCDAEEMPMTAWDRREARLLEMRWQKLGEPALISLGAGRFIHDAAVWPACERTPRELALLSAALDRLERGDLLR